MKETNETMNEQLKLDVRAFADRVYLNRQTNQSLPQIRTKQEAYGYLAECYATINAAASQIKGCMNDAMKTLSCTNATFAGVSDGAYSAALEAASAAIHMAVNAQNIGMQLLEIPDPVEPTPLEQLAAENSDDEELPDDNDNDKPEEA